jgi:hypothetical protein
MASIPNQWELNDMVDWQSERRVRDDRLKAGSKFAKGKIVAPNDATALLEAVVRPGDRICLEGDNQKQADFLAACLAKADPKVLHDLHVVQSGIVLPEHLDLFEKGIARKLDFSFSGPQSENLARVLKSGKIELGAIHTYIELFGRYFIDLTLHVALTVARSADRDGNLYMGPNWRPLIALADTAGGKWPGRARAAALALSGSRNDDGIAVAVLAAIKDLFAAQRTDRLGSKGIVAALTADPTARLSESNRGRPLSEAQLARLLRPFEIYPTSFGSARGYRLSECQDAFARYVKPDRVAETVKVSKPAVRQALSKSRQASKTTGRDGWKTHQVPRTVGRLTL